MFGLFNKNKGASDVQPNSQGEMAPGGNWRSILNKADARREIYGEAVAALNVKVICELAPLVRDRSKYESFHHEAINLALSIQDELYRSFAIKQVEGLSKRAGERPWREPTSKTPLKSRQRPKWLDQGLPQPQDGSRTTLV
jgi:hypothetical protein